LLASFRGAMTFASDRRAPTCPWGKCDTINPIMPSWFYWGGKAVGPRMTNGFVIGDSRLQKSGLILPLESHGKLGSFCQLLIKARIVD
jgi:hypothetical protein